MSAVNYFLRNMILTDSLIDCAHGMTDDDVARMERAYAKNIKNLHTAIRDSKSLERIEAMLVWRIAFMDDGVFCHLLNKAAKAIREKKLPQSDIFGLISEDGSLKDWVEDHLEDTRMYESRIAVDDAVRRYCVALGATSV